VFGGQSELVGEDAQDVFFLEDQAIFVFDAELAAGILVEQHLVADLDVFDLLPDGLYDTPLRHFLYGIREIDPAGGPFHFLSVGDEQTVTKRLKILRSRGLLVFRFRSHTQSSFW